MTPSLNPLAEDLNHIISKTAAIWKELRGARIFITGGTGFIGSWLLESIVWANQRCDADIKVSILSRYPEEFINKAPHLGRDSAVTWVHGDVKTFAFPGDSFSHIIHAATAASAKLNKEFPLEMIDTIVQGTRRTLDFALHCKAQVILQTSSCGVYGRQPPELELFDEDYQGAPDPLDLWSCYSESKRLAELLGAVYSNLHGFGHKVARISSAVGPYMPLDVHFAIGNFIRDGLSGGPIKLSGDGTPYRANLYIADAIIWLWTILVQGKSNRPYNVGSERSLSLYDTARAVNNAFGGTLEIQVARKTVPGTLPSRYVASTNRARSELNLDQWINLPEAIAKTVRWHKTVGN